MLPPLLVALFLAAHGLLHASFVSPRPAPTSGGPEWPFDLAHSAILGSIGVGEAGSRAIGVALLAVIVLGYVVAALAVVGIGPAAMFVPSIVTGTVASLVMLALFFHPWLVLGIVIDVVLLAAVLAAGWRPGSSAL